MTFITSVDILFAKTQLHGSIINTKELENLLVAHLSSFVFQWIPVHTLYLFFNFLFCRNILHTLINKFLHVIYVSSISLVLFVFKLVSSYCCHMRYVDFLVYFSLWFELPTSCLRNFSSSWCHKDIPYFLQQVVNYLFVVSYLLIQINLVSHFLLFFHLTYFVMPLLFYIKFSFTCRFVVVVVVCTHCL